MHTVYVQYLITGRHFGTFLQQQLHQLKVAIANGFQQRRITILHSTDQGPDSQTILGQS